MLLDHLNSVETVQPQMECLFRTVYGAILFADISGFTRLSASLNSEDLKFHINQYFSLLLGIVTDNHGDVIKFCGDAIIVLWPVSNDGDLAVKSAAIKLSVVCALEVLDRCGSYTSKMTNDGSMVSLRLHCGIACGSIHCLCLGDLDRWEFLVSGPALKEVGMAERAAGQGELCLAENCYNLVADVFVAEKVKDGIFRLTGKLQVELQQERDSILGHEKEEHSNSVPGSRFGSFISEDPQSLIASEDSLSVPRQHSTILIAIRRMSNVFCIPKYSTVHMEYSLSDSPRKYSIRSAVRAIEATSSLSLMGDSSTMSRRLQQSIRSSLRIDTDEDVATAVAYLSTEFASTAQSADMAAKTRLFVPEAARVAIESDMTSFLAELRVVVTLFVEVLGLEEDFDAGLTVRPLRVISVVLATLKKFEGSLRQYVVDDKGCVIIAAFGLPGSAHEDNSVRAIETAVRIRHLLNDENIGCKVGITQGRVYCGLVGYTHRCEYAMMGSSVNLAARFMGRAGVNEIVVSEDIYQSCVNDFRFVPVPKIKAKGYTKPVSAYAPMERLETGKLLVFSEDDSESEILVERTQEMKMLVDGLAACISCGRPTFFLITGAVGIGKSWLFSKFHRHIVSKCLPVSNVIVYTASTHHTNSRYYCIRQILDHVLGILSTKQNLFRAGAVPSSVVALPANKRLISTSPSLVGAATEQKCLELTTRALLDWMEKYGKNVRVQDLDLDREVYSPSQLPDGDVTPWESCFLDISYTPLSGETPISDLLPLLVQILCIDVDQTALCASLSHRTRTKLCVAMVIKILGMTALTHDRVLMIENLAWCDSPSLEIISRLLTVSTSGCFVGTVRTEHKSVTSSPPHNLPLPAVDFTNCGTTPQKFLTQIGQLCTLCNLQPLSASTIRDMVEKTVPQRFLRAEPELLRPSSIAQIIIRTDGKPYLTSAFVLTLRDSLVNGKYRGLEFLPSGEQNIIIHRFDKLDWKQQMILKVASVIGGTFSLEFLREVLEYMGSSTQECVNGLTTTLSELLFSTLIVTVPIDAMAEEMADCEGSDAQEYYRFTTKNVRYSIYNLMLSAQKEATHGIVGKLLEQAKGNKFEEVSKHYILSNNTSKKLHYLQESIFRANVDCNLFSLKSLLSQLLVIATGMTVEEMLRVCSIGKTQRDAEMTKRRPLHVIGRKMNTMDLLTLNSKWMNAGMLSRKLKVKRLETKLEHRVADDCNHLQRVRSIASAAPSPQLARTMASTMYNETGGQENDWRTQPISTIDIEIVCFWIAELGSVEYSLGQFRRAHNLFVLSLVNLGVRSVAVDSRIRSNSWTYRAKEWLADRSGLPEFRHSGTANELVKSGISMTQTYLMRGQLAPAYSSLRLVMRAMQLPQTSKNFSHQLQVRVLHVLLGSYQGDSYARSRTSLEQLELQFDRSSANAESRGVCQMLSGMLHFSNDSLQASLNSLKRSLVYFERAECSTLMYGCTVHRGWVQLLSGNFVSANRDIVAASQMLLRSGSNEQLNKWVVELRVVCSVCKGDLRAAQFDWEKLRSLRKRDGHSATSSALAAFIQMRGRQYVDASVFAQYACTRLVEKTVTSVVAGVFLFFAGYSALRIIDIVNEQLVSYPDGAKEESISRKECYPAKMMSACNSQPMQTIASPSQGRRIVGQLGPLAASVIAALQRASCHIPILSVLCSTLTALHRRISEEMTTPEDNLTDIDQKTCFKFGMALYNAERAKGLDMLGDKYRVEALEATVLAHEYFELAETADYSLPQLCI